MKEIRKRTSHDINLIETSKIEVQRFTSKRNLLSTFEYHVLPSTKTSISFSPWLVGSFQENILLRILDKKAEEKLDFIEGVGAKDIQR